MKKIFTNKYLKLFLGVAALTPVVVLPTLKSIETAQNNFIVGNRLNNLQYGWQTNNNTNVAHYSTPSHMKKGTNNDITYDLDAIQQDTAYDDANTSYAAVGSTVNNAFNNDLISKFWLSGVVQTKEDGGTTTNSVSVPGSKQWSVKKSDLASLISVTTDSETKIKSILYSGGGELVSKALFVILSSTNATNGGSYLFEIKWEDDVKDLKAQKAGDYRLVRKLAETSVADFNFMTLEAAATHTIHFFELKEYQQTSSPSTDYTIKSGKITGTTDFTNNTDTQPTYTITVSANLFTNKVIDNVKYKPIFAYRSNALGNNAYFIYQAETYNTTNSSKYLFTLKVPTLQTTDFTVDENTNQYAVRTINLDNATSPFKDNTPIVVTMMQNTTSNYMMFFSQDDTTTTSSIYGHLNLNLADTGTSTTYKTTKIDNPKATGNSELYNVSKLYSATSEFIGYIFLDKSGKAYQYDMQFKNPILLYNFKQSTIALGDIYKVVTSPSSASWFAQMTDSTFGQFSGSTFVGQWDKLAQVSSTELPINFSIKSQNEIAPSVISQKVAAGSTYASEFINYLANGESYKDFLNVTFQDPRLTISPSITISQSAFVDSQDKIYSVELTFKQKLRKIDYNGNITSDESTSTEVTLAKQTYKFNNAISKVLDAHELDETGQERQPIPIFIKNKLPSQITEDEVKNYLVVLENVNNPIISTTYNDSTGSMRVIVTVPYMWEQGGNGEQLVANKVFAFDYSNYFYFNSLGSSASITEIDNTYINKPENSSTKSSLLAKYGAKVPSSVDPKELINSFVIFGPAFSQQTNYDSGVISPQDEWLINVIPYDREGKAKIDILIPTLANSSNVRILFETPSVFLANPNANSSVYFMFKENNEAMTDDLKKQSASTIASKLNSSNGGNNSGVISNLQQFASFSDFFVSYINDGTIKVTATGNDNYGTLKIVIDVTKDGQKLPGFSSSSIEAIYQGFARSSGSQLTNDTFKFKDSIEGISNISPLNMTADRLMNEFNIFDGSSEQTKNKITTSNIVLNKSTITGTIQVIVTIENYVENNNVYPQKSFITTYSGFKKSQEPVDMVVWKSFYEITTDNQSYKNSRPSDIINSINTTSMLNKEKLNVFANVSTDLSNKISDSDISIILEGNDGTGELTVTATIKVDDTSLSLSTIINCNDNQSLTPVINLLPDNSNSADLAALRNKLPSAVTPEEASKLYSFTNANSYVKEVNLVPDDSKGFLSVNVRLLTSAGAEILSSTNQYTQFAKFIPQNEGTNWGIVVASVLVPTIILMIPIIILGVIQDNRHKKKIAKKLDNRLNEEYKKEITKKY